MSGKPGKSKFSPLGLSALGNLERAQKALKDMEMVGCLSWKNCFCTVYLSPVCRQRSAANGELLGALRGTELSVFHCTMMVFTWDSVSVYIISGSCC